MFYSGDLIIWIFYADRVIIYLTLNKELIS